ncbi:hypothetical protein BCV70DRAFT_161283 [Testicularia cyperi]|uniref:CRAL-TRIO domain-containing protein n=1 Tax=Testicularia cyperi TaxID=1882483 RepID=A0A317XNV7_9BASI|nr:hypothetical protein BCV70DRAFT_161283 [Testicularia cyperi]
MVDPATSTSVDYLHSPGYRCNLTPHQTLALFKLWRRFLRLCEITSHSSESIGADTVEASEASVGSQKGRPRSRKQRLTASEPHSTPSSASASNDGHVSTSKQFDPSSVPKDDKLKEHLRHMEESKEMQAFLMEHGGAALRREFWAIVKGEHPDAYMLRCLRARKWDVERALAVIGSTCAFRVQYGVSKIMKEAELGLTKTRGGFNIMANGLSYIYGATAMGEPVYFIEVGSHYSSNQTAEELKRGVILLQESLSLLMPPPVERKVVIFNLNNFGIRNMDWGIVLFMAKTMESFYPETISRIYVHGAPWIFKPIWSILRPLLDPVVRDKVHLTWRVDELAEHVPADHLPKGTMEGELDWAFEYPVPVAEENDIQDDIQAADELSTVYRNACMEFEYATRALARAYGDASLADAKGTGIRARFGRSHGAEDSAELDDDDWEPEGVASLRANRDILATKVRVAWLKLKPYVIGTLKYDRWGVTDREGVIRWEYPTLSGTRDEQVLGEGTSLSALESNLAELDALLGISASTAGPSAHRLQQARSNLNNDAPHDKRSRATKGADGSAAFTNGSFAANPAASTSKQQHASASNLHVQASSEEAADKSSAISPTQQQTSLASQSEKAGRSTDEGHFEEMIPIHPSEQRKLMEGARDGDVEVQKP